MVIISPPGTAIYVSTLRSKLPASIGRSEKSRSIEEASERIRQDARRESELKPKIVVEDNDRIPSPGGERIIRVSPNFAFHPTKPMRPLATVAIIATPSLTPEVQDLLAAITETNTKRLLILEDESQALPGIEAINNGFADALLFRRSTNYSEQLVQTALRLKRQYAARRQVALSQLLANGATAFLTNPDVAKLIDTFTDGNVDCAVYLSLDPPGVLIDNGTRPAEFHLICDEDYRRGIAEIRGEVRNERQRSSLQAAGFGEGGNTTVWDYALSRATPVGADKKWFHSRFADAGEDQTLFKQLMVASNRCGDG